MGTSAGGPATTAVATGEAPLPRAATSSNDLLEQLHRKHARSVFMYLLRLTFGDTREAEDFLQETMLRAWKHLRNRPADVDVMRPWLCTVARNVVIDAVRARHARPGEIVGIDFSSMPGPTDTIDRMLVEQSVRAGLRSLSTNHRRVLVEVYYKDRPLREAAEALGIAEGTVKSRIYYALRALAGTPEMAGLVS